MSIKRQSFASGQIVSQISSKNQSLRIWRIISSHSEKSIHKKSKHKERRNNKSQNNRANHQNR